MRNCNDKLSGGSCQGFEAAAEAGERPRCQAAQAEHRGEGCGAPGGGRTSARRGLADTVEWRACVLERAVSGAGDARRERGAGIHRRRRVSHGTGPKTRSRIAQKAEDEAMRPLML